MHDRDSTDPGDYRADLIAWRRSLTGHAAMADRNEDFTLQLRFGLMHLIWELWPIDPKPHMEEHFTRCRSDVDAMQPRLLQSVAQRLFDIALEIEDADPANAAAHEVLAGWLMSRYLEVRLPMGHQPFATRLKKEYSVFLHKILLHSMWFGLEKKRDIDGMRR